MLEAALESDGRCVVFGKSNSRDDPANARAGIERSLSIEGGFTCLTQQFLRTEGSHESNAMFTANCLLVFERDLAQSDEID